MKTPLPHRSRNPAAASNSLRRFHILEEGTDRRSEKIAHDSLPREQVRCLLAEAAGRQVFDTAGAAEYLGLSRQLLELMRVSGDGPRYAKLGRLVRYRRPALDEWLIERERSHTAGVAR